MKGNIHMPCFCCLCVLVLGFATELMTGVIGLSGSSVQMIDGWACLDVQYGRHPKPRYLREFRGRSSS